MREVDEMNGKKDFKQIIGQYILDLSNEKHLLI